MNWLLKEMEECGADGVDFVPVFGSGTVYATYSKAEILDMINRHFICVPKSSRRYWKGTKDKKNFIPVEETPGVYEVTDSSLIGSAMANGNWSGVHQACVARENRFFDACSRRYFWIRAEADSRSALFFGGRIRCAEHRHAAADGRATMRTLEAWYRFCDRPAGLRHLVHR